MTKLIGVATAVAVVAVGVFVSFDVAAQGSGVAKGSLASSLLQSRTQASIFKADDKEDLSCRDKRFVDAAVVSDPIHKAVSAKVTERKWQEQWTLARCGDSVGYRVFFTEVGDGGAYFSFVRTE